MLIAGRLYDMRLANGPVRRQVEMHLAADYKGATSCYRQVQERHLAISSRIQGLIGSFQDLCMRCLGICLGLMVHRRGRDELLDVSTTTIRNLLAIAVTAPRLDCACSVCHADLLAATRATVARASRMSRPALTGSLRLCRYHRCSRKDDRDSTAKNVVWIKACKHLCAPTYSLLASFFSRPRTSFPLNTPVEKASRDRPAWKGKSYHAMLKKRRMAASG